MEWVEPKVIRLAETKLSYQGDGLGGLLKHIGATGWNTDAQSQAEALIEVAGRLCYRSFAAGLNKNVQKVREGNRQYMANILSQRHGSVLEHASVTYAFLDVSRVFTHEQVRHRPGMAYSQESLRYVRLDKLKMLWPQAFERHPKKLEIHAIFQAAVELAERTQAQLAGMLGLDDPGVGFDTKKQLTSAMRRLAPDGLATAIICTGNHRAWRHLISMRTSAGAEEEIQKVYRLVYRDLVEGFPNIYQDGVLNPDNSIGFTNDKV